MKYIYENSILPKQYQGKIPYNSGFYYNTPFYYSIAYQSLTKASRDLLHCFLSERRYNRKTKETTNNGSISFTQKQFIEIFKYSKSTYLNSRNQLIELGFIRQTYRGGDHRGDMAKYEILCFPDVNITKERWRAYPEKDWKSEIPKSRNQQIGKAFQWKKGECGRYSKFTVKKNTQKIKNERK